MLMLRQIKSKGSQNLTIKTNLTKHQMESSLRDHACFTSVQEEVSEQKSSSVCKRNVFTTLPLSLLLDVLNRYPDPKDQVHAKHILKYIFPRQFGLHNVFTVPTDRRETTHSCKDYTDRESEIAGASRETEDKVYRRLGAILPLITKMQKLHQQCSYHGLINYYCSAVEDERLDLDDDMSLDSIEESMELTQKEISTISTEISMEGLPPVSRETDIIRHHTPQYKVI